MNPAKTGHDFEGRVKNALLRNNYMLIKKNKWVKNYALEKDYANKREYDLVMFNTKEKEFYVIECKAHLSTNRLVPLKQVMKFNYVANAYTARRAKKMIATDTDLTFSARQYADRYNINVLDGRRLRSMEQNPETPHLQFVTNLAKMLLSQYLSLLK